MMEDIPTDRTRSLADGSLAESVPLHDFLAGLGPLMRLPPRDEQSGPGIKEPEEPRTRNRFAPVLAVMFAVVAASAGGWLIVHGSGDVLPPEVLGSWKTDDPRYAGREFRLGPAMLTLQTGPGLEDIMRYPIREVEARIVADTTRYLVRYNADGVDAEFGFSHVRTTDQIVFEHQSELRWHRLQSPGPS